MSLFKEVVYANNQKALKPTNEFLLRAWEIHCQKHVGKLSADAIRALLSIGEAGSTLKVSSHVAEQLTNPFYYANNGAALFPDEFQPWESVDLSLCTRSGFFFLLTFEGEVMHSKMRRAIESKYDDEISKLNLNRHICTLEV